MNVSLLKQLAITSAVIFAAALPAFAQGVDNRANSVQGGYVDGNSFNRAFAFTTDASSNQFSLNSVTLRLAGVPANPSGAQMALYTDSANLPGTLVGNLSASDAQPFVGDNLFEGSNLILSASTTYWLSFSFASGTSPYYTIPLTNLTAATGSWTLLPGTLQGTSPYTYRNSNDYLIVSIAGSPYPAAVPEPSSFAAIAGLAMLGFASSRRRRR